MNFNQGTIAIVVSASLLVMAGCADQNNNAELPQRDLSASLAQAPERNNMAMMQSMNSMKKNMNGITMTGDYDYDFANMMIEHHKGAIDMSAVELKYGNDPKMERVADGIVTVQKDEITVMDTFLKKHTIVKSDQTLGTQDAIDEKMNEMSMSGNTDQDFASMMTIHHQIAVVMAEGEMFHGQSTVLKEMARQIIADQLREIAVLRKWSDNNKY